MITTRQLAAFMFADIVGYTRLFGEDEQKALQMLRKNRKTHQSIIKKHHSKWLKEMEVFWGGGVIIASQL